MTNPTTTCAPFCVDGGDHDGDPCWGPMDVIGPGVAGDPGTVRVALTRDPGGESDRVRIGLADAEVDLTRGEARELAALIVARLLDRP